MIRLLILLIGVTLAGAEFLIASPVNAQVTQQHDLTFGTILTGTTSTVGVTSANAAEWRIRGILSIGSSVTFTLPTALTGAGSLPVTFCTTCAVYNINVNSASSGTTFNPHTGFGIVVSVLSNIYVWLGASVNPPLNQAPGSYSAPVVITVAGLL